MRFAWTNRPSDGFSLEGKPAIFRYGVAVIIVLGGTLLRSILTPLLLEHAPYGVFYAAIVITAILCGFGPSILAAVLSSLIGWYYFLNPTPGPSFETHDLIWLAMFLLSDILIAAVISRLRTTIRRLDILSTELQESEARYRALFNSMGEGFGVAERISGSNGQADDFRFVEVNPAFEVMSGFSTQQLQGMTWRQFAGSAGESLVDVYRNVAATGKAITFAQYMREMEKWFQIYVSRPEPGKVAFILTDITQRKLNEQALERQAALLDLSPDAIMIRSLDGVISFWNSGAETMYGWAKREAIGRRTHDLLKTEFPIPFEKIVHHMETHDKWSGELRQLTRDGRVIMVESRWQFRHDTGDILESNVDITARKYAEQQIRNLNQDLERRVEERTSALQATIKELESFSYSISHDLRAPLRAINSFASIVLEDAGDRLDEDSRENLHTIISSAISMGQLIDDLLAFSRLGQQDIQIGRIAMETLARNVLHDLEKSETTKQEVQVDLHPLLDAVGSEMLVRQVFVNLLGNSFKFTKSGQQVRVEIGAYRAGAMNVYYVKDNGVGFDMEYVDKLFGVFQRLHPPGTFEGTGIGLALVKRIIERHGGWVKAESAGVGKGATFSFSLPAAEE